MRARGARAAWAAGLVATILAASAGCKQTASLTRAEVVVVFKPAATQADHSRVYAKCASVAGTSPEPLVTTSKYPATLRSNVRYRVDHATNFDLQQLYNCLTGDPSVAGYTTTGDQEQ